MGSTSRTRVRVTKEGRTPRHGLLPPRRRGRTTGRTSTSHTPGKETRLLPRELPAGPRPLSRSRVLRRRRGTDRLARTRLTDRRSGKRRREGPSVKGAGRGLLAGVGVCVGREVPWPGPSRVEGRAPGRYASPHPEAPPVVPVGSSRAAGAGRARVLEKGPAPPAPPREVLSGVPRPLGHVGTLLPRLGRVNLQEEGRRLQG